MTKKTAKNAEPPKPKGKIVTVAQINEDKLTQVPHCHFLGPKIFLTFLLFFQLAHRYWSPETSSHEPFDPTVIEDIYRHEIQSGTAHRIVMLEFSQYLERYLWPNFNADTSTHAHLHSIVVMMNEKFREKVSVWHIFDQNTQEFPRFFRKVMDACLANHALIPESLKEQCALILLLNHCFNNMEVEICRNEAKKLVSLSIWSCLQSS